MGLRGYARPCVVAIESQPRLLRLGPGRTRESCRRAGISVNLYYRWEKGARAFAFLDNLVDEGCTVAEIEAAVMAAERRSEGTRP